MCSAGNWPVTQAYADRRVQRPDWWPAAYEWNAFTVNNLERGRLDELFMLMRDWKSAREVRRMPPNGLKLRASEHQIDFLDGLMRLSTSNNYSQTSFLPLCLTWSAVCLAEGECGC